MWYNINVNYCDLGGSAPSGSLFSCPKLKAMIKLFAKKGECRPIRGRIWSEK